MDADRPKSKRKREFEEAVRRASERQKERKANITAIEGKAQESPDYALRVVRELAVKAHYRRRRGRRYLYSRFGIKVYCGGNEVSYEARRPERSPKGSRERLLRAKAVVEHGEWENVWRAVWKGFAYFGPTDQGRMACKFATEAMRQTPALWGYFIERQREPDERVREYALAELAGWLDQETRLYGRTRKVGGSREERLRELASAAAAAWADLQPGEPFWLPNTFVAKFSEKRKKGSLAGRGSSYVDAAAFRFEGIDPEEADLENVGPDDEGFAAFEAREDVRRQLDSLMEAAGLSPQQAAVYERLRGDLEPEEIAAELGIPRNQVYQQRFNAENKLRRAAGQ